MDGGSLAHRGDHAVNHSGLLLLVYVLAVVVPVVLLWCTSSCKDVMGVVVVINTK